MLSYVFYFCFVKRVFVDENNYFKFTVHCGVQVRKISLQNKLYDRVICPKNSTPYNGFTL